MGFSGVGASDLSHRLNLEMTATETNSANNVWTVVFKLRNATTSTDLITETFTNAKAADSIRNGSAIFGDFDEVVNKTQIEKSREVEIYFSDQSLENNASFASRRDDDNDGLPNVFEAANTTPSSTTSLTANSDTDNDGLNALAEFRAGSNPRASDTDGDGVLDGIEVANNSNPSSASSKPPFIFAAPATGEDFNGDALADAWQARFNAFGLAANVDTDGDGITNAQEALAGTNPRDALSRLWSRVEKMPVGMNVYWPRILNKRHQLFASADLTSASWQNLAGTISASGAENTQNVPTTAATRRFFQVRVSDQDTDSDGLSDASEAYLGLSPTNQNSSHAAVNHYTSGTSTVTGTTFGDVITAREMLSQTSSPSSTTLTRTEASRFLMQATFGPTMESIDQLVATPNGITGWVDNQLNNVPASYMMPKVERAFADFNASRTSKEYLSSNDAETVWSANFRIFWARMALQSEDQLRQRVAFALSQILVISRNDGNLTDRLRGISSYYDILVRNAFGNYRTLLGEVTLHPTMGRYLSHAGNEKADPAANRFPDENYAREVMQLFSIGLWQLQPNGERVLNSSGQPIPTYTNNDITELAKVMTGFWYHGRSFGNGGYNDDDYIFPMSMHALRHDFGPKTLLNGLNIPARQATDANALADLNQSLDFLFNHPNCGPFICKQLIQFLVTDNPSPAYVQRVAAVFTNNGSGVRGDLKAVTRAIVLDAEARNVANAVSVSAYGKLREPLIKTMHLARVLNMHKAPFVMWWDYGNYQTSTLQEVLYAPSVFNFFRPDYSPSGVLGDRNLTGPVFGITNSYTAISLPNITWEYANRGFDMYPRFHFPPDFTEFAAVANNIPFLLDRVNLTVCAGRMSASTRSVIETAVTPIPDLGRRSKLAIYLAMMSPEGSVQR